MKLSADDILHQASLLHNPFDEIEYLCSELRRVWSSYNFSMTVQKDLLGPTTKDLCELVEKAVQMQQDIMDKEEIEKLRSAILKYCTQLGVDANHYLDGHMGKRVAETLLMMQEHLRELQQLAGERRRTIDALTGQISKICKEVDEVPPSVSVDDLSTLMIDDLKGEVEHFNGLKKQRIAAVTELSRETLRLWSEDESMDVEEHMLIPAQRKLLAFQRTSDAHESIGLTGRDIAEVAEYKQQLLQGKRKRLKTTLEANKRLQLIEERQVLVDAIRQVEAGSANPLRLFGESTKLNDEDRFRKIVYPRLLVVEEFLRPALEEHAERTGRPFLYKGKDYLQMMKQEVFERRIPPEVEQGLLTEEFINAREDFASELTERLQVQDAELDKGYGGPHRWMQGLHKTTYEQREELSDIRLLGDGYTERVGADAMATTGNGVATPRYTKKYLEHSDVPMVLVPPEDAFNSTILPAKCKLKHSNGGPCDKSKHHPNLSVPSTAFYTPEETTVVPKPVLVPKLPSNRVRHVMKLSPQQVSNLRAPKHIRYCMRDKPREVLDQIRVAMLHDPIYDPRKDPKYSAVIEDIRSASPRRPTSQRSGRRSNERSPAGPQTPRQLESLQ